MTEAKVICDSVAPHGGRLITVEARLPTFIIHQITPYGSIANNFRSQRAVRTSMLIGEVSASPVMPARWGKRTKGMVASEALPGDAESRCKATWLAARDDMIGRANSLESEGAAKEISNRLLTLWTETVGVLTASYGAWCHYLNQRIAVDAQPEHRELARAIGLAIRGSRPFELEYGWWHLPYVSGPELGDLSDARGTSTWESVERRWLSASVRRVRRISYSPFDGTIDTPESDKAKHDESRDAGHWSCFEHQGQCLVDAQKRSGKMTGYREYRQTFPKQFVADFDFASLG